MAEPVPNTSSNNSTYNSQRRMGSDRSDLQRPSSIRNVRTSSMPGSNASGNNSTRITTDQAFTAQYAKSGLQPSWITNNRREKAADENRPRYEGTEPLSRNTIPDEEYAATSATPSQNIVTTSARIESGKNKRKISLSLPKNVLAQVKAKSVTTSIWSWGFYSWIFFQLPFAILGLAFMVLAASVEGVVTSVTDVKQDDGLIVSLAKGALNVVTDATVSAAKFVNDKVLGLFDVDLTSFNPNSVFLIPYGIVLAYGIFILLLIYLIYKLSFLEPLSGNGGGVKKGAFLLALIGYSVPGLNLLPWFFVWTMAVMRYPK
jgi:uncharacterized membrane protein